MSTADDYAYDVDDPQRAVPRVDRRALAREVVALLLVIVGLVGFVVSAFLISREAGAAAGSLVLIAVGVVLGIDR